MLCHASICGSMAPPAMGLGKHPTDHSHLSLQFTRRNEKPRTRTRMRTMVGALSLLPAFALPSPRLRRAMEWQARKREVTHGGCFDKLGTRQHRKHDFLNARPLAVKLAHRHACRQIKTRTVRPVGWFEKSRNAMPCFRPQKHVRIVSWVVVRAFSPSQESEPAVRAFFLEFRNHVAIVLAWSESCRIANALSGGIAFVTPAT